MAYFTKPDGTKVQAGDILRNPAYAATIRKIAAEGPKALLGLHPQNKQVVGQLVKKIGGGANGSRHMRRGLTSRKHTI